MKKGFLKFWKYAKTAVIPAIGAAIPIAAAGVLGPKAQAVAIALTTLWGVFSKRPQDDPAGEKPEVKVALIDRHEQVEAFRGRR